MTISRNDPATGVRDPKPKPPPLPYLAFVFAIFAGLFAIYFTYRLGFDPKGYVEDNMHDYVILASVLWIAAAAFIAGGLRDPKPKPPPTPGADT